MPLPIQTIGRYLEEKEFFQSELNDGTAFQITMASGPGEKWKFRFSEVEDPTKEIDYVSFDYVAELIERAEAASDPPHYADAARSSLVSQLAEEKAKRDAAEKQLAAIRQELEAALKDVDHLQAQVAETEARCEEARKENENPECIRDWEEDSQRAESRLFEAEEKEQEATRDLAHFKDAFSSAQVHCTNLANDLLDARGDLNTSQRKLLSILALPALADHPDVSRQIMMIINGNMEEE